MVITNLEHLSLIALENDRETSRNVKGGIEIWQSRKAVANVEVEGFARGDLAALVVGAVVIVAITR